MKTIVTLNGKNILVTGSPGFIGANLVIRLLKDMNRGLIVSLDNMNDYYELNLKKYRLSSLRRPSSNDTGVEKPPSKKH